MVEFRRPARHPGAYVKEAILNRRSLSVTAAAKLIGIGRPALSNFLNGNADASPEMALRLERAFKIPAQELLDMQASYDAEKIKSKQTNLKAAPYVAPYLLIKANDIEAWAATIGARVRVSVLLRTLIHSTSRNLARVDFPGNDDAQRPGWDGFVDALESAAWIPDGISGWEFGTDIKIKAKADGDIAKSEKVMSVDAERLRTTFVFVTPRRWPGKASWIASNKARGRWKDVRAYDASDLEQWLEQSLPGQAWFANETQTPSKGVQTLDACWKRWAGVANPPLVGSLFEAAITSENSKRNILSRLSSPPSNIPTVIAADSADEALAFLSQLFSQSEFANYRDRTLVFEEAGTFSKLVDGNPNFIAVTANRAIEREFALASTSVHTIVIYPRNAFNAEASITLEPVNHGSLSKALEEMGYDRDDIARYDRESGRSLTVLRRRLALSQAVQKPVWAEDHEIATRLLPYLLVGSWRATNESDTEILGMLANEAAHENSERNLQSLLRLDDTPVWSESTFRGVVSQIDLLFAIRDIITADDLTRFFQAARLVLSEDDPALDLPEKDRWWKANYQGKVRQYSTVLRNGISETLMLLAVHGKQLFLKKIGYDTEGACIKLIRDILTTPLTARILEANDRDLPTYAETAPNEFLNILEKDLKSNKPATIELLRPSSGELFGGNCPRTGLLWALEKLAWNPATLHRAATILARLSEIKINDSWSNKPINSLKAIFRSWMPQTAATIDERLALMQLLAKRFPEVAWEICSDQFGSDSTLGEYSAKPRWRGDGYGYGEPVSTWGPILAFRNAMIEMALTWPHHSSEKLCDLIKRLHELDDSQQDRVLQLIITWAKKNPPDLEKALVRDSLRVTTMSRRDSEKAAGRKASALYKEALDVLVPSDVVAKHEWLFRDSWVQDPRDEIVQDEEDYRKREERIADLRINALDEVFSKRGTAGIFELTKLGKASPIIGRLMVNSILKPAEVASFLMSALPPNDDESSRSLSGIIFGALRTIEPDDAVIKIADELSRMLDQGDVARIMQMAPFRRYIWQYVDQMDQINRDNYWRNVECDWLLNNEDELNEAVERLLTAKRPRAAFACVRFKLESVKPHLLFRTLLDAAGDGQDKEGEYRFDEHRLEDAIKIIDKCGTISTEEKARLEFAYLEILAPAWRHRENSSISNLERYIEDHPELFIHSIVWAYKRKQRGEDPEEWNVPADKIDTFARKGNQILDSIQRIPGSGAAGERSFEKLLHWVQTVRHKCVELDREDIGDECIGKLLSHAPKGDDDNWPCEPVRSVMETLESKHISRGAHTGLYNQRGVVTREESGRQERELAEMYQTWADNLKFSHPFVAATLLSEMARTYFREAEQEDARAGIHRRLR